MRSATTTYSERRLPEQENNDDGGHLLSELSSSSSTSLGRIKYAHIKYRNMCRADGPMNVGGICCGI